MARSVTGRARASRDAPEQARAASVEPPCEGCQPNGSELGELVVLASGQPLNGAADPTCECCAPGPSSPAAPKLEVLSSAKGWISLRYPPSKRRPDLALGIQVALAKTPGVLSAQVNSTTARVRVQFDPERIDVDTIGAAIIAAKPVLDSEPRAAAKVESSLCADPLGPCCYIGNYVGKQPPAIFKGSAERTALEARQVRIQRRRVAIAGVAVGALLGAQLVFGAAVAMSPLMAIAAAAATVASGYPLLKDGFRALTGKSALNPNALVAAATVASLLLGEGLTALVVIGLLNVGAMLQMMTLFRTRRAIQDLLSIGDKDVWLVVNNTEVKVPLASLQVGDVVAVYSDQKIPVDGVVLEGTGSVNQALITGESMPVYKHAGDDAYAGTILELGSLRVRADRVGSDTEVGRLIDRVEQARELRAPMETVAESFSRRFVPFSFLLAAVVFALTRDIRRAMTMLVIACPCAAGLSTPTAVTASIGNAAKRGVLIKGGANLEAAGKLDTIILDKTGTLTMGKAVVTQVVPLDSDGPVAELMRLAASAELHSKHPLAMAIMRHAAEAGLDIPDHDECEVIAGRGMRATTGSQRLLVGSDRLLADFDVPVPPEVIALLTQFRERGETAVCVAVDERILGVVSVSDTIRPQAREAIEGLHRAGIERVILCTGDSEQVARIVAAELGIAEYYAEYRPEDKFSLVQDLKAAGHRVGMVGDGINDAPALALADVGIAMGAAGSDVAIEAADISLAGDDLRDVATVLDLSRHTIGVVKQNYAMALGVNGAGILVGAVGTLNPIMAAVVHNLSTIAVVANSGRLIGYQPPNARDGSRRALRTGNQRAVASRGSEWRKSVPLPAPAVAQDRCCDDDACSNNQALAQRLLTLQTAPQPLPSLQMVANPGADKCCDDPDCSGSLGGAIRAAKSLADFQEV